MTSNLNLAIPAYTKTPDTKTRMVIRTIDGKWVYNVRMAPKERDYTNLGSQWSEIAVPGGAPFLVKESFGLKKLAFTLTIADPNNMDTDMTKDLQILNAFANTVRPIKIAYSGYFDAWTWRCTSLSIHTLQAHPLTSKITSATADLEFTQKRDVADFTGPVTGGAKANNTTKNTSTSNTKKKATKSKTGTKKATTKVYVVKKGDTLSGISYKLYGTVSKWRELADTNGIKNPRLLQIGTRLKYS